MSIESAFKLKQFDTNRAAFNIFTGLCKGCGLCIQKCPTKNLVWSKELGVYGTPAVEPKDTEGCTGCGICSMVCPDCAIVIKRKK